MSEVYKATVKQVPNVQTGNPNDSLPTVIMDDTVAIMDDPTATMGQPRSTPVRIARLR